MKRFEPMLDEIKEKNAWEDPFAGLPKHKNKMSKRYSTNSVNLSDEEDNY